ncbi:MAG: hypothetical protein MJY67_07445 [Bacteroidales bacterium]|nr:hypothetical protein [Bacteroidales bacterium]
MTPEELRKRKAREKATEIKQTCAKALLEEKFKKAGIERYKMFLQKYRVKIFIKFGAKYTYMAIILYKDILAGKLDEHMDKIFNLAKIVESIPFEIKVCR